MYVSKHHQFTDQNALLALMQAHPLGAWVCQSEGQLIANHIPFLLDPHRGSHGTLIGHVARANPVWRACADGAPSVVMFQGAQSYITPHWYPGKAEHGKVVPTWNYVVAHAHGQARIVEDRDWMLDMLQRLTTQQEATQPIPWRVADAPADYIDKLMRAIVGIEIPIDRLEGKCKASQDEDLQDRYGTVKGLRAKDSDASHAMADVVMDQITQKLLAP